MGKPTTRGELLTLVCPAPAPRGAPGTCGVTFQTTDPRVRYCSHACAVRVAGARRHAKLRQQRAERPSEEQLRAERAALDARERKQAVHEAEWFANHPDEQTQPHTFIWTRVDLGQTRDEPDHVMVDIRCEHRETSETFDITNAAGPLPPPGSSLAELVALREGLSQQRSREFAQGVFEVAFRHQHEADCACGLQLQLKLGAGEPSATAISAIV
ncbi:MAG: hypothetical protein JOZ87_28250 [Chloroflexi bacterium]|nr:hypothetical protein [Chloroflexota bacterium]